MTMSQPQSVSPDLAALRIERAPADPLKPRLRLAAISGLMVVGVLAVVAHLRSRPVQVEVGLVTVQADSPPSAELTATGYAVPERSTVLGTKVLGRIAAV